MRCMQEMDRSGEEHAKIVEMDMGEPSRRGRSSCSVAASEPWSREGRRTDYYDPGQCLLASSAAITEITSPRAYNVRFEDFEPATERTCRLGLRAAV
ncbi:hypothetical protein ZWY2020_015392 [Hordeum vulgare]|nr:hypothetical protein ZWY2020_015392 [Hordeum vulgare]